LPLDYVFAEVPHQRIALASKHVHFIHFNVRSGPQNEVVAKVEAELLARVVKGNEAIVQAKAAMPL